MCYCLKHRTLVLMSKTLYSCSKAGAKVLFFAHTAK